MNTSNGPKSIRRQPTLADPSNAPFVADDERTPTDIQLALDANQLVDGTLAGIEQTFETETETGLGRERNSSEDTSGDERGQNPRLTLLHGGVKRTPSALGAPVSTTTQHRPHLFSPILGARHEEPALRYVAPPIGPALWSASAEWTDLTQRRTVGSDLPSGTWTTDWSLTYRHGDIKYESSVANVSARELLAADPIRENSWHRNKTARAGLRYMHSTDQLHAHESLFERKLLRVLDFHGATAVSSQPFTLTWDDGTGMRHHTPDFLADIDGQLTVINTRPAPLVKDTLLQDAQAIAAVCLSRGWDHALVVGYPLPAFTIIETVGAHADSLDHLGYTEVILDTLTENGPTTFDELCRTFESPVIARAILQRLIWQREVSVDLATMLEDTSLVALPGEEVRS